MPERGEVFLYVRASRVGRTHIGGTFCPNDTDMAKLYSSIDPAQAQQIAKARSSVAEGQSTQEAIDQLNISPKALGKVANCLLRIESGWCPVFPDSTT